MDPLPSTAGGGWTGTSGAGDSSYSLVLRTPDFPPPKSPENTRTSPASRLPQGPGTWRRRKLEIGKLGAQLRRNLVRRGRPPRQEGRLHQRASAAAAELPGPAVVLAAWFAPSRGAFVSQHLGPGGPASPWTDAVSSPARWGLARSGQPDSRGKCRHLSRRQHAWLREGLASA